jgi:amidohydrolase
MNKIHEEVIAEFVNTVAYRRHMHENPELSFKEYKTAGFIENTLKSFGPGLEIRRPTPTSVMAVLKTGKVGPILASRADIDALPIVEDNNLPFKSTNNGVMHACGHDGHAAMQLSTVKLLLQHKDELKGEFRFIFQHAEELPPGGAIEIVKTDAIDGVDEFFGFHLTSNFETGKLGWTKGILTASTDGFEIEVIGKGGHSSFPQQCIDPIPIASQIVMALQTIVSRNCDPNDMLVISICTINGGDAYNIISESVKITGSIRTFSKTARDLAQRRIGEIAEGIAKANNASIKYDYNFGYNSVYNEEELSNYVKTFVKQNLPNVELFDMAPISPGEDFCYFSEVRPSFFMEIGARNEEKGIVFPHHNPKYLLDENALSIGVEYLVKLFIDRSNSKKS